MTLLLIIYEKTIPASDRTKSVFITVKDNFGCVRTHSLFTVEEYEARVQDLFMLYTVVYILTGSTGLQTVCICLYVRQCRKRQ